LVWLSATKSILAVEEDRPLREMEQSAPEDEGLTVATAADGRRVGTLIYLQKPFDLDRLLDTVQFGIRRGGPDAAAGTEVQA
jgi:DNA-binding response OmpR family regulator